MTFAQVSTSIHSLFSVAAWTSKSITMYPDNYQGKVTTKDEYARLVVLPSKSANKTFGGVKAIDGMVSIQIFVKAGEGASRLMVISDHIDDILQNKVLSNGLELGSSYISVLGLDSANQSLYGAKYIIPFKSYGE